MNSDQKTQNYLYLIYFNFNYSTFSVMDSNRRIKNLNEFV